MHCRCLLELILVFALMNDGVICDENAIEELITRWAPLIWLAPEEKFFPSRVEEFLQNVHVTFSNNNNINRNIYDVQGIDSEQYYLVTNENLDILLQNKSSFIYGKNPNEHKTPIYALVTKCSPNFSFHVTADFNTFQNSINTIFNQTDSYPHFYVSFWTFYAFNEGKKVCFLGKVPTPTLFGSCLGRQKTIGNHVGDWEHVSLFFTGKRHPDKMYMSVHDAGVYYKYEPTSKLFKYERQVTRKGIMQIPKFPPIVRQQKLRPVLFSAYGSHGIWSAPGEHYYVRVPRLIDKNGYGTAWETWKNIEIFYSDTKNFPRWALFRGKWGNPQSNCFLFKKLGLCEVFDGPRGLLHRNQDFSCFSQPK